MSDISTTIVPEISDYPNRFERAQQVIDWLIDIHAIRAVKSDCILSSETGYPIDIGAKALTTEPQYLPFNLVTNGLQVVTERSVFDAGENGLDRFLCPNCREDIVSEDWDFTAFVETGNSMLECPLCNQSIELNEYIIEPIWGFSNLGFVFWNWSSLADDFIKEFERRLECNVKVVESRI